MIHYNPIISGSLIVSGSVQVIGGEVSASLNYNNISNKPTLISGSSQLTASLNELYVVSGSITQTTWDNIASKPSGIVSSSIQVLGGTDIVSSSAQVKTLLPDGSVSGSTQILGLGFVTGSYVTINEYNYLTQSFNVISASVVNISNDIDAGVFATTGSNTFLGTQIVTGSMYVTGDMVVQGSSSLQNITASAVSIGTNVVYLNTNTPAVRFAGLSVFDSGSTAATGSLFWDSENERWIYQKASGSSYSGGMLISGPRNLGALGDEVGMPTNKLIMGIGGDHISSSNIYHNGIDTAFAGNVEVTGSIRGQILATNGVVSGSSQVDVMSTTNIARLATTGSNQFNGNQSISGSVNISGSLIVTNNTISFGTTSSLYVGPAQYSGIMFPRGQILYSNTNTQNQLYLSSNAYTNADGVFAYRNSSQPALFVGLDNGTFSVGTAGNGTANGVISFSTAFSITSANVTSFAAVPTANSSPMRTDANTSYSTTFSSVSSVSVTHNLGTKNVMVMCYDSADEMFWPATIKTTSTTVVDITFTTSRSGRVVIIR